MMSKQSSRMGCSKDSDVHLEKLGMFLFLPPAVFLFCAGLMSRRCLCPLTMRLTCFHMVLPLLAPPSLWNCSHLQERFKTEPLTHAGARLALTHGLASYDLLQCRDGIAQLHGRCGCLCEPGSGDGLHSAACLRQNSPITLRSEQHLTNTSWFYQ